MYTGPIVPQNNPSRITQGFNTIKSGYYPPNTERRNIQYVLIKTFSTISRLFKQGYKNDVLKVYLTQSAKTMLRYPVLNFTLEIF